MSQNTIWNEILKKEANGIDDNCDLGEIQKVEADYIVTAKGIINKLKFSYTKASHRWLRWRTLYFGITRAQAKRYLMDKTSRFSS